eukprot:8163318-Ditylum_brightwellii.AAC.1
MGGQCHLLRFCPHYRPPALLVPFPGFWARRVAPASDDGAVLPWWQWWWDNCVPLGSVLFWMLNTADGNDGDNNDGDDDAYGTKNGVNV